MATAAPSVRTPTTAPQIPVQAAASPPAGNWETLFADSGLLTVGGWAVDLDRPATPVEVHVYVDGRATVLTGAGDRPDVGAVFASAGAAHGFSWSGGVGPGVHSVCVYAIAVDLPSRNTPLGCRSIEVGTTLPAANWDALSASGSTLSVTGWAVDLDSRQRAVPVHVYVDGAGVALSATDSRPDVGAAFPGAGAAHGFSYSVPVAPGVHSVCVYAIDVELPWRNTGLGCRSIGARAALPLANWEVLTASGSTLSLAGWAFDPDDPTGPVAVHVYVDGVGAALTADSSRPDVGAAFPGAGAAHGFSYSVPVAPGVHSVCVYAIDVALPSRNTALGCRSIAVAMAPPLGNWEVSSSTGGTVTVQGWALDPDQPTVSTAVHMYVDGLFRGSMTADRARPDVGAVFRGAGPAHGFNRSTAVAPGVHTVCLYAIDLETTWRNTGLGCRSLTVVMVLPEAEWEELGTSSYRSTVWVTGWAFDRDDPAAHVDVHVYVDGVGGRTTADLHRPDVGAWPAAAGDAHGFWYERTVGPGAHEVCVYAIDSDDPARNTPLGCDSIEVALALPEGEFESLTRSGDELVGTGWGVDPDQPREAVSIEFSVDGRSGTTMAGMDRPDVAAEFPGAGSAHGFSFRWRVQAGTHRVCVTARDLDSARGTALGCRDIVVPALPVEDIQRAWERSGSASGPLGGPLGDAQGGLAAGGYHREFEHGAIYWTSGSGAHLVLSGLLRDGWELRGAERGPLGYPSGDTQIGRVAPGSLTQEFAGGLLVSSSTSSAALLTGAIRGAWLIGPGRLVGIGYPVADARCGLQDGGCVQEFEHGLMTASPTAGAWWLLDAVAQAWLAEGAEHGSLGYPVAGSRVDSTTGWQTGEFEHGRIEAQPADPDGPFRYQVRLN